MDECPEDWPADWKQVGSPLVRRESTIHRLNSPSCRRSICVKVVNGEAQDAASLYQALSHYHARSDLGNGYTVPEPFGWVPEHGAVIMEWVEGQTLCAILKRKMFFTKRRHENIRKAAGWLRWFHSQSELEPGNFGKGKQLKSVIKVFEEARDLEKAATVHDPALEGYLELALKSKGVLRGVEMDRAILHRDFKPTNLLITSSGVVVGIDFLGRKKGPVTYDICRLLSELDFYQALRGRSLALSFGSKSNDFEVFLSAYGGRAGGIARPVFVYLYFLTIVSILAHQRRRFKSGAGNRIRLAFIRRFARQLSHEVSKWAGNPPPTE
ncbi:MAG: phosphotransferase [Verrucomicrobiota bacterium]